MNGCRDAGVSTDDRSGALEEARSLIGARRYSEGLEIVRALVEAHPEDAELQRLYGEALLASGQASLSVWPLSRAMKDPAQTVAAGLLLINAQLRGSTGADAIATANRVLAVEPDNAAVLILRAQAYLRENVEEKALEDLDRAEGLGVNKNDVDLLRLDAYLGLRREEDAEKLLDELHERAKSQIEENPAQAARLCAATAMFAFEKGDRDLAAERFDECLEGDAIRNGILVKTAVDVFDKESEFERATEIYKRRFESDPKNLMFRVHYADRLQQRRRSEEGLNLLLEATEDQPAAWAALIDFYVVEKDFEKALEALEKAIELHPQPPDGWYLSRADFLIILGDYAAARKSLSDIQVPSHRALIEGRLAAADGKLEEAARFLEEGIRLWPDNPDARHLAGTIYERLGDFAKAASHYREAARMDPPHYESSRALAEIQNALGDKEGTGFLLLRLSDYHPQDPELMEAIIDYARTAGLEELGRPVLSKLSKLPGMGGRALKIVASMGHDRGGPEEAIAAIDRAGVDLGLLQNFEVLALRTQYLEEMGRFDEALAALEALLAKFPNAPRVIARRGETRLAAGEPALARADFERALAEAPSFLAAAIGRARSFELEERLDASRRAFEKAVELENALQEKGYAEFDASIGLARVEARAGDDEAARTRLEGVLLESPRHGEAALALTRLLAKQSSGRKPSAQLVDVARRAAFFERSEDATRLYQSVQESTEN